MVFQTIHIQGIQPKPTECVPPERWKQEHEQEDELDDTDAGQNALEETSARASDCWQLWDNFRLELRIERSW